MVQFYPWFKFSFLLFLGMVMYDNNMIMSLKQKKRKFEPRIKLNHNIYTTSKTIIDIIGNLGIFDLRNPVRRRCIDLAVLEIWRVGGRGHDPKPCHSFSAEWEFFLHRIQQCLRKQLTFYDPTTGFPVK